MCAASAQQGLADLHQKLPVLTVKRPEGEYMST